MYSVVIGLLSFFKKTLQMNTITNFKSEKLEDTQLISILGGSDIIEEEGDFSIIIEDGEMLVSIIEDDSEF